MNKTYYSLLPCRVLLRSASVALGVTSVFLAFCAFVFGNETWANVIYEADNFGFEKIEDHREKPDEVIDRNFVETV